MGMTIDPERFRHTEQGWGYDQFRIGSHNDAVQLHTSNPRGALTVAAAVKVAAALLRAARETANGYGVPLTDGNIRKYFAEVGVDIDDLGTDKLT